MSVTIRVKEFDAAKINTAIADDKEVEIKSA